MEPGKTESNRLTPCGVAQKDLFWSVEPVKPAEEQCGKVICACSGDGLHTRNASLGKRRRVQTQDEFRSSRGKLGQPSNGQVLVIIKGVTQQPLCRLPSNIEYWSANGTRVIGDLFNDGKHPWPSIVISIRSHAEVDLFRM